MVWYGMVWYGMVWLVSGYVYTISGGRRVGLMDGRSEHSRFHYPNGVTTDVHGNVYVTDQGNSGIRVIMRNATLEPQNQQTPFLDEGTPPFMMSSSQVGSPVPEALSEWGSFEKALQDHWRSAREGYYVGRKLYDGPAKSWHGFNCIQKVLEPSLFLSNLKAANDKQQMESHGITHVLVVQGQWDIAPNSIPPSSYVYDRENCKIGNEIQLQDYRECVLGGYFHLDDLLMEHIPWIETAIAGGGKVLICCQSGVSLSPAVATGYIMFQQQVHFEKARSMVSRAREVVQIPEWLHEDLFTLDESLRHLKAGENEIESGDDPSSSIDQDAFNTDEVEEEKIRRREWEASSPCHRH
mmetsp:Transcript_37431/g.72501  ORF Transcript_37431/g.72501 Transcript_37431/m.72501 type:complete len:353 (-) Transcript_37431:60-1118(-)